MSQALIYKEEKTKQKKHKAIPQIAKKTAPT